MFWLALAIGACVCSLALAVGRGFVLTEDIGVSFSASPTENLLPGQPIDFNLTVTNHGDESASPIVLMSSFFLHEIQFISQHNCVLALAIADGEDFFVYFYAWYVAGGVGGQPLQAGESRTCHFQLALTNKAPASYPFTFGLPDSFTDPNPDNDRVTVTLRRGDIAEHALPLGSSSAWMLLALGLMVLAGNAMQAMVRGRNAGP